MGSFSWLRADRTTKRSNLTKGDRYKILIPKEFGGGFIKDTYYDYGHVFHGTENEADLYGILAYWNGCEGISQIFHDDLELIAWIEKEEKANVKRIKDNIHDAKELVELMYSVIEDCEFMPVADLNDKKIAIKERAKEIFDVKI